MTAARAVEYRIVQQLMRRRGRVSDSGQRPWSERLITVVAVTVGLAFLGSYLQEMLWVLLTGGVVLVVGTK